MQEESKIDDKEIVILPNGIILKFEPNSINTKVTIKEKLFPVGSLLFKGDQVFRYSYKK